MRLVQFGPFEANFTTGELRKHGIRLKLQDQPLQILKMLLARPGELVTREEIRQNLWPSGTFVDFDNGLNAAVNRLREALSDSAENAKFIETLPRRGYRFVGVLEGAVPAHVQMPQSADSISGVGEKAAQARPWWHRKTVVVSTGVVVVVLLVLLTSFAVLRGQHRVIDSVAILPFVNATPDAGEEYLSEGITESVTNSLSQLPNLRVVAWTTMSRYKGKEAEFQKIGKDLRVRAVLSGKLLQRGDTLIVEAELVDVANSSELWGGQYRHKMADAFALQEDLSSEISERLRIRLTAEEKQRLSKRFTESAEAYQSYLKGLYFWNKWTEDGVRKSIDYFQQAIHADPNYALAYAGLANSYISMGDFGVGLQLPKEANSAAEEAARKALSSDETLAAGHAALAMSRFRCDGEWRGVESEFKRAIELNPGSATTHHWYSHYLLALGRKEEAIAEGERAYDLSPVDPEMGVHMQFLYLFLHRYDDVIEQGRKTLELDPNFSETHFMNGQAYELEHRYKAARSELQAAADLSGRRSMIVASLGHLLAVSGDRRGAKKILAELEALSRRRYVPSFEKALVNVGLGDNEEALRNLEKAYQEGSHWMFTLQLDARLDPLRSDARFQDLLRRIDLPD